MSPSELRRTFFSFVCATLLSTPCLAGLNRPDVSISGRLSPDGRTAVLQYSDKSGIPPVLVVYDVDTDRVSSVLGDCREFWRSPVFSPGGDSFVFHRYERKPYSKGGTFFAVGDDSLQLYNLHTGSMGALTPIHRERLYPVLFLDKNTLFFKARYERELWKLDLHTKAREQFRLADRPNNIKDFSAALSITSLPDGSFLFIRMDRATEFRMRPMGLDLAAGTVHDLPLEEDFKGWLRNQFDRLPRFLLDDDYRETYGPTLMSNFRRRGDSLYFVGPTLQWIDGGFYRRDIYEHSLAAGTFRRKLALNDLTSGFDISGNGRRILYFKQTFNRSGSRSTVSAHLFDEATGRTRDIPAEAAARSWYRSNNCLESITRMNRDAPRLPDD